MSVYQTTNGAKPRYDGKGTEFGMMHRDLGPGYLMLDVDRLRAEVRLDMDLRRENECFVEYRRVATEIKYVALFEVKANQTEYAQKALDPGETNSIVRADMARRLGARLFVVFGTDGKQPFDFYEIDTETAESYHLGQLAYSNGDRVSASRAFWKNVLGIER